MEDVLSLINRLVFKARDINGDAKHIRVTTRILKAPAKQYRYTFAVPWVISTLHNERIKHKFIEKYWLIRRVVRYLCKPKFLIKS